MRAAMRAGKRRETSRIRAEMRKEKGLNTADAKKRRRRRGEDNAKRDEKRPDGDERRSVRRGGEETRNLAGETCLRQAGALPASGRAGATSLLRRIGPCGGISGSGVRGDRGRGGLRVRRAFSQGRRRRTGPWLAGRSGRRLRAH